MCIIHQQSLVKSHYTISDISDQHMVVVESDVKKLKKIKKEPPRKIFHFTKADWTQIKAETAQFTDTFLEKSNQRTIDENWNNFKQHIDSLLTRIPSKTISGKNHLPWLTPKLKKLVKKKNKLYFIARASKSAEDWTKLKKKQKPQHKNNSGRQNGPT